MTNKDKYKMAALKAADWFVRSQIVEKRPNWDANNGRFPYHVHFPSGYITMGLNWTMARAIMVLLSAYKLSGKKVYLESAERATSYNKSLQILDKRSPHFGSIHEETPQSPYCYPRDAIECVQGYLMQYRFTGDKDLLYRADIYLKWYLKNAVHLFPGKGKWIIPEVRFDGALPRLTEAGAYQSGGGQVFYNAYLITKNNAYKRGCLLLADSYCKNWLANSSSGAEWHMGANDDGGAITLLCAYKLTRNEMYINTVTASMDKFIRNGYVDENRAGLPCTINTMLELGKIIGHDRYRGTLDKLLVMLLKRQDKCGGFKGEDENTDWYVKGADKDDFVVTRVTAYAALALFKAAGFKGYGYTADFAK
jgi:hypothetical protein